MPSDPRPEQWRERAEERRATGETMRNIVARRTLLETADQGERMADQLERLLNGHKTDGGSARG
jgi:hypothetical protein